MIALKTRDAVPCQFARSKKDRGREIVHISAFVSRRARGRTECDSIWSEARPQTDREATRKQSTSCALNCPKRQFLSLLSSLCYRRFSE